MSSGLLARVGRAVGRFSGGGPAGAGESGRDALRRVRVAATRVALVSTAIVAGAYLVIAVVVVLIVTGRETSEIDTQLTSAVSHSATDAVAGNLTPDRTAGSPLQYWVIASDGTLAGFGGGLAAKEFLLNLEGARFRPSLPEQASLFGELAV